MSIMRAAQVEEIGSALATQISSKRGDVTREEVAVFIKDDLGAFAEFVASSFVARARRAHAGAEKLEEDSSPDRDRFLREREAGTLTAKSPKRKPNPESLILGSR